MGLKFEAVSTKLSSQYYLVRNSANATKTNKNKKQKKTQHNKRNQLPLYFPNLFKDPFKSLSAEGYKVPLKKNALIYTALQDS